MFLNAIALGVVLCVAGTVCGRETLLYGNDHKTPVTLRFVGGPDVESSVRPRSGKSNEQQTTLRLLPRELSNVRLHDPKPRKLLSHENLPSRTALIPADNSVSNTDLDLNRILQRTTMKMRPYFTTTESPKKHSENEITEESASHSTLQQQPPKQPKQSPQFPQQPPAQQFQQQQIPQSTPQPQASLPKAAQLPPLVPVAAPLTPPVPTFSANVTPPSDKEPLGCGWDILSTSCKDVFGLGWCLECRDFGNIFFHDCKCARPSPNIPTVPPPPNPPQVPSQLAPVSPFPLVPSQPQIASPSQIPPVPQVPQLPQIPQVPQFPTIPQTPPVGVLPPPPQQLFILRA